jgi:hypothetical protein
MQPLSDRSIFSIAVFPGSSSPMCVAFAGLRQPQPSTSLPTTLSKSKRTVKSLCGASLQISCRSIGAYILANCSSLYGMTTSFPDCTHRAAAYSHVR